jgi:predicted transcriptional regulator
MKVTKSTYYRSMLTILNSMLNLTDMELDIMATLLENKITIVDSRAREILRLKLNKDKFNINNYIRKLLNKNVLYVNEDKISVNPHIIESVKENKLVFNFETIEE